MASFHTSSSKSSLSSPPEEWLATGRSAVLALLDPAARPDPYPLINKVRESEPIWMSDNVVVFAGQQACDELLRDTRASSFRGHSALFRQPAGGGATAPVRELASFLFLDPPDHTRLRRLASKAFTPRMVRGLEPAIREIVDDLLDAAARRGTFEAVEDLAYPLPVAVICRMLGVPEGDAAFFRPRSSRLSRAQDPNLALLGTQPPGLEERKRAEAELNEYFVVLAAERRKNPGDDLLSSLISVDEDGDRLTPAEIGTTCRFLLNAGHETTVNLISNAVLALLREPRHIEAARDLGYAAEVVEEVLRLDPPVQLVHRYAAADLEVCGTKVPRGTTIVLLLAGANRDPAAYGQPDEFAPRPQAQRHLAFGLGIHFCLGAPLARLEGQLAVARFAQRLGQPRFREADLAYKENVTLRGLSSLPVQVSSFAPRSTPWT